MRFSRIILSITLGLVVSFVCLAWEEDESTSDLNTYFGINYKHAWIKPQGDWERILVNRYPGFAFYFGARFHPYFGAELGYEWTATKPKTTSVFNNGTLLNVTNTTGTYTLITAKNRFQIGFLDLVAFLPLSFNCEINPEALIAIGISSTRSNLKVYANPIASPFTDQFVSIKGRTQAIGRVGLGLQSLIIESVGLRLMWRWEGTRAARARHGVAGNPVTRVLYQDATSISVGFFVEV